MKRVIAEIDVSKQKQEKHLCISRTQPRNDAVIYPAQIYI